MGKPEYANSYTATGEHDPALLGDVKMEDTEFMVFYNLRKTWAGGAGADKISKDGGVDAYLNISFLNFHENWHWSDVDPNAVYREIDLGS